MTVKEFHILLQNGCLYKNVKVLTDNSYATSSTDVYWNLISNGYIYITNDVINHPIKLEKKDIYHFCVSYKYNTKNNEKSC